MAATIAREIVNMTDDGARYRSMTAALPTASLQLINLLPHWLIYLRETSHASGTNFALKTEKVYDSSNELRY
jgi:hypothetical protein